MELTPPPSTSSPASPPPSYCSPNRHFSPSDYPTPGYGEENYGTATFATELASSLARGMDPDTSLLPVGTMGQSEWASTPTTSLMTGPSTLNGLASGGFDPFSHYERPTSATFVHGAYGNPSRNQLPPHDPATSTSSQTLPSFPSRARSSIAYPPGASLHGQLPQQSRLEVFSGSYGSGIAASQFGSPQPAPTDAADHGGSSAGYQSDGQGSIWTNPDDQGFRQGQFFSEASGQASSLDPNRAQRANRAKRAPRKLTTKEEANFRCEVPGCGKLFGRSYNFKAHMETHDEKREYPFPCLIEGCTKKFVRKTDLQRHHQSVHAKERNHRCDYCGRLFARKDTLRRHMEDGCSKRFDIGTLDIHAEGYGGFDHDGRSSSHMVSPVPDLPPTSMSISHPVNASLFGSLPSVRDDLVASHGIHPGHGGSWGR